ncbi:hypothetical protein ABZY58_26090 [Micromonospora tulbaghiae]|uniref:hypothetical protein n=1 Tax=Micromonospora tulbaghiae TaxID=479978 RepID=UPI0033A4AA14
MAEDARPEPGQDDEAAGLRQQLATHKATIKGLIEQVATAHNALRALARAYADAVPGAAEPGVAEQGCDDCSVEPGERHRYIGCPGNERAAARGQDVIEGLLANAGRSLASAVDDAERAEAVEMLLDGWYAAWPDSAVTSPSYPLATELVRLLRPRPQGDLADRFAAALKRLMRLNGGEGVPSATWDVWVTLLAEHAASAGPIETTFPGTIYEVLAEVLAERRRQDVKWGEQNHPDAHPDILGRLTDGAGEWWGEPAEVARRLSEYYEIPVASRARYNCRHEAGHHGPTWVGIAIEEMAEVLEAAVSDPATLRAEWVQLAAVAVAAVEAIDRRIENDTTEEDSRG